MKSQVFGLPPDEHIASSPLRGRFSERGTGCHGDIHRNTDAFKSINQLMMVKSLLTLLVTSAFLLSASAVQAVTITATTASTGPFLIGQDITINLAVSGWQSGDGEVDAIGFNVDWDPAMFTFVTNSASVLTNGTEFLSLANQGVGYSPNDDIDDSLAGAGRLIFGITDTGDATAGSIGPDGALGSFTLRGIQTGTTDVSPSAVDPDLVFYDTQLFGISPSGGINFNPAQLTVVPEPSTPLLAILSAAFLILVRKRNA